MNQDQVDKLTATIDSMGEWMGLPLGSKPWHEDAKICVQYVVFDKRKRPSKSQRIHSRRVKAINRMCEVKPTSSAS